jgi:hypothetical protein
MTYEELKAKAKWFDAPRNWGDTDEEILANIKVNIQLEASKQYINLLTNVDMNVRTTTKDLLEALSQAGFPPEKITVKDEHKAEIDLEGTFCTITDARIGHAFLYDNNNTLKFLDFIHTPANLVAAYLVERYCSENWLEDEAQRRLVLYKEREIWREKKYRLGAKFNAVKSKIERAMREAQPFDSLYADFIKTGMKYYKCENSELTDETLMSKSEKQWEDYKSDAVSWAVYYKQEKRRAAARARYDSEKARIIYETVTKPRMQAKKQKIIEQKLALLHEYKEKYGIECRFIYVHSPYDPHHRFVVPAVKEQVVSFFAPDGFDHDFYDKAMRLVSYLNELTTTYGKSKVQKKGSLPDEANKALSKLLGELGIARQWQGIYNESQLNYLNKGVYKDEVDIKQKR